MDCIYNASHISYLNNSIDMRCVSYMARIIDASCVSYRIKDVRHEQYTTHIYNTSVEYMYRIFDASYI